MKIQIPFSKKIKKAKGLTALSLMDDGVAVAHVSHENGQPQLTKCAFLDDANFLTDNGSIKELIQNMGLEGTATVVVIPQGNYQLLLVDAPDVPADEVAEALRWRVKDLVGFDIETAKMEYVELPADAYRGRSKMLYAIVAQESYLKDIQEFTESLALLPNAIDVPELAMLNVTAGLAASELGLAVFHTSSPSSSINLLSDGALYFTRSLSYDVKDAQFNPSLSASSSVLELQRSLDYYESQVGKPPCVKLQVFPLQEPDSALLRELSDSLPLEVVSQNLSEVINISPDVDLTDHLQRKSLLAIMAAFRPVEAE